jgi:hypothetical protein
MAHRIRQSMRDTDPSPLGGEGKIIPSSRRRGHDGQGNRVTEAWRRFDISGVGCVARLLSFPDSWAAFVRVPAAILLRLRKMEDDEIAEKARTALRAKRHNLPSLRSLRSPAFSVLNHGRHGPLKR